MLFLNKKILFLLFFCSILLAVPEKILARETSDQKNEVQSEQKIMKDAETVAKHEAQTWNEVNAAKKRQAAIEAKIRSDAESRRKAERVEWKKHAGRKETVQKGTSPATKKNNIDCQYESGINPFTTGPAQQSTPETETTRLIKQNQAKTVSAEEYLKIQKIEKKKAESEVAKLIKLNREKTDAAEKKLKIEISEKKKVEAEVALLIEQDRAKTAAVEKKRPDTTEKNQKVQNNGMQKDEIDGKEQNNRIGQALLWYIPNRFLDLADIFTLELGCGELGIDLALTRLFSFGAGVGQSYMLGWHSFRQYGIYWQLGWYSDLLWYRAANVSRESVSGSYKSLFSLKEWQSVDFKTMNEEKKEDIYAIGAKVCCCLNIKIQIHPIELADFIAGFFFIDFQDDDVKRRSSSEKGR